MINPKAKLNPSLFNKDKLEYAATRDGYGKGLIYLGEKNKDVVVLCCDLTESTRSEDFAKKFPERFFEVGVAEQNMAGIAAGMAVDGKIPFISSYAMFSPGRNWEQVRTRIGYNDANVKIAGAHSGVSVGPDGATHQAIEDIAIMRPIPNMRVFVPCDSIETKKATIASVEKITGPVYIRFGREKSSVITTEETPFELGKAVYFWLPSSATSFAQGFGRSKKASEGKPQNNFDVLIVVCGMLTYNALLAAKELEQEGVDVAVLNCASLKPMDEKTILDGVKKAGAVVTVEEHQITGGLGGAIAELLAKNNPVPMEFVGVQNRYGESGPASTLIEELGMGVGSIKQAAKKAIERKS